MSNKLKRLVSSLVPETYDGIELIDYLSRRYDYQSREAWLELIAAGDIRLNDVLESPEVIVHTNDKVDYDYTPKGEPEVDRDYRVLYEDEALLVINKPGDLPMHPAGKFFNHTLWAFLKEKYTNVHFINRLDRETSGIVLVAKDSKNAAKLAKQFERRQVAKEYQVIVEGEFTEGVIEAKGYLEPDETSEVRKKQKYLVAENFEEYGKSGVHSLFTAVSSKEGRSLVQVKIHTGKMHQIRATLYSLGYPIVGDKIYGVDDSFYVKFIHKSLTGEDKQRMVLGRQALHAQSLTFQHPTSGEKMYFDVPLPDDMKGLV